VGLYLANAVAPVAGQDVPVVTLLNAILIVDAIAAALWYLGLAARGAGGVAHLRRATAAAGPAGWGEMDPTGSACTGSVGSTGASTGGSTTHTSSVVNRCAVAPDSCQRENCGEAQPCKLAYG
jgi:hypothetical protein